MIIGIAGKMGSGKDSVAKIIQKLQPEMDWRIEKFAGKLKSITALITGVPIYKLEDQEFKDQQIGEEWGMTYRELMQILGTEGFRNSVHPNIWVNAMYADYKKHLKTIPTGSFASDNSVVTSYTESWVYPNWLITDVRFINEAESIRKRRYPLIRVTRNQDTGSHSSETALDNYKRFDFEIDNSGSIYHLEEQVRRIMSQIG